ncbi:MAG TPA: glycosyltransferase [Eubacteriales bacterium]|mgnify:CR=1 FL=1|nr:glycosyltransferase [Eubacteriales bacterium]
MLETPVRVLEVLTVPFAKNGITMCVMNYISRFDSAYVRCDLLAPTEPDEMSARLIEQTGGQVFVLGRRNSDPAAYMHKLSIIVSERKEQIVHAHGNSATLALEMLAAKHGGAKVRVAHSHNTTCKMKLADKALRGTFRRNYTHAMACGDAAGGWLFGDAPFTVLKNAIPASHFHYNESLRAQTRGEYHIPAEAFVVCHVGTFNEQKNQAFLLDAFAKLLQKRPDARLILAGEGRLMPACRERAAKLGIDGSVVFTGALSDVAPVFSAADVFALPSLHEGLPLTLIEAQSAGLPCVVSDRVTKEAALTELVMFCGIGGAEAFADALLQPSVKGGRDSLSDTAIRHVRESGYDVNENAKQLVKWYESLVREAET